MRYMPPGTPIDQHYYGVGLGPNPSAGMQPRKGILRTPTPMRDNISNTSSTFPGNHDPYGNIEGLNQYGSFDNMSELPSSPSSTSPLFKQNSKHVVKPTSPMSMDSLTYSNNNNNNNDN